MKIEKHEKRNGKHESGVTLKWTILISRPPRPQNRILTKGNRLFTCGIVRLFFVFSQRLKNEKRKKTKKRTNNKVTKRRHDSQRETSLQIQVASASNTKLKEGVRTNTDPSNSNGRTSNRQCNQKTPLVKVGTGLTIEFTYHGTHEAEKNERQRVAPGFTQNTALYASNHGMSRLIQPTKRTGCHRLREKRSRCAP